EGVSSSWPVGSMPLNVDGMTPCEPTTCPVAIGKFGVVSVVLAMKAPDEPGFSVFVLRRSVPALKWQLAPAVTLSEAAGMSQKSAWPSWIAAALLTTYWPMPVGSGTGTVLSAAIPAGTGTAASLWPVGNGDGAPSSVAPSTTAATPVTPTTIRPSHLRPRPARGSGAGPMYLDIFPMPPLSASGQPLPRRGPGNIPWGPVGTYR